MKKPRSISSGLQLPLLLALASVAGAAVVGPTGYTNDFALQPAANEWSSTSIAGGAGDSTSPATLDADAQTLAASGITAATVANGTDPADFNALATWGSTGLYLQLRSTGVRSTFLMATLTNGLGGNASSVAISFDYNRTAAAVEEVDGLRVFYSLTGAVNSWTLLPSLFTITPGRLSTNIVANWPANAPLYILFADDNGSGSPDTAYQIDNFSATATPDMQLPVAITDQPQNQTVAELVAPAAFSVMTTGFQPINYQWYTNEVAWTGATNSTLNIASVPYAFNGLNFKVTAQNVASNVSYSVTSSVVTLTVNADLVAPTLLGFSQAGNNQAVATFSEKLSASSVANLANYSITSLVGNLTISNATPDVSQSNILFTTGPLTPGATYRLTVNGVTDQAAAANAVAANSQAQFTASSLSYADIGSPAIGGTVLATPDGYNITGAGTNITGTADQFTFGYAQTSGDFDVKLRVQSLSSAQPWARAGLMARDTLAANSRFAATLAGPNVAGEYFQSRLTAGVDTTIAGWHPVNYPYTWMRLSRVGDIFTGYGSLDGQNWVLLGSSTIAMPATVFLGYAVSGASASQAAAVQFRDYQSAAGGVVVPFTAARREPLGPSARTTGLVISEIMYHPKARVDGKVTEFIELYNSLSIFEDIGGWRISGDVNYTFPTNTLIQPGQFIVLAKVKADVESVYGISGVVQYGVTNGFTTNVVGNVTNVTANIDNSLNNSGGTVRLHNRAGAVALAVDFSTRYPWPIEADGAGHSLVLARPSYGESHREAWGASDVFGGSPGGFDAIGSEPARDVLINEFLAGTDLPQVDYIELYNHGNTPVNLSGFWLSDRADTNKFRIPDGVTISPRGFVAFTQTEIGFSLSGSGEQIFLVNSNQNRVIDAIGFQEQQTGVSMGRYPDGAAAFRRQAALTPGASNSPTLNSPVASMKSCSTPSRATTTMNSWNSTTAAAAR